MQLLTQSERKQLIELLLRLPNSQEAGARRLLLANLPNELSSAIANSDIPQVHIASIVDTVASDTWAELPDGTRPILIVIENAINLVSQSTIERDLNVLKIILRERKLSKSSAIRLSSTGKALSSWITNSILTGGVILLLMLWVALGALQSNQSIFKLPTETRSTGKSTPTIQATPSRQIIGVVKNLEGQVFACLDHFDCNNPAKFGSEISVNGEARTGSQMDSSLEISTRSATFWLERDSIFRVIAQYPQDGGTEWLLSSGSVAVDHDPAYHDKIVITTIGEVKIEATDTRFTVIASNKMVYIAVPYGGGNVKLLIYSQSRIIAQYQLLAGEQIIIPQNSALLPSTQPISQPEQQMWEARIIASQRPTLSITDVITHSPIFYFIVVLLALFGAIFTFALYRRYRGPLNRYVLEFIQKDQRIVLESIHPHGYSYATKISVSGIEYLIKLKAIDKQGRIILVVKKRNNHEVIVDREQLNPGDVLFVDYEYLPLSNVYIIYDEL